MDRAPERTAARILVVDDDIDVRESMQLVLAMEGFEVVAAESGVSALRLARDHPFDVVVTDLKMPGISGQELLVALRHQNPSLPVIVASAFLTEEAGTECRLLGARGCIRKPFTIDDLVSEVEGAVSNSRPSAHEGPSAP